MQTYSGYMTKTTNNTQSMEAVRSDFNQIDNIHVFMAASVTPWKTNICVVCGFSFISSETSSGKTVINKHFNRKLKLSDERVADITSVLPEFNVSIIPTEWGICITCFAKVEKVKRTRTKIEEDRSELSNLWKGVASVLSSHSDVDRPLQKRALRSPLQPVGKRSFPQNTTERFILPCSNVPKEPEVATGAAWIQLDQQTVKQLTRSLPETVPRPTPLPPPPPPRPSQTVLPRTPVSCCNSETCRRTELSHLVEEHYMRMELLTTQLSHLKEEHTLKMEVLRMKKIKLSENGLEDPPITETPATTKQIFGTTLINNMETVCQEECIVKQEPVYSVM